MKKKKHVPEKIILYPVEVTTDFIDRCTLHNHKFTKHLKLGHFILVELKKDGFKMPKNPKQYETERSASIAFHEYNKLKNISTLKIVERISSLTGFALPSPNTEETATENTDGVLTVVK